jgi:enoyl-[acyl-carrier protein] reductase I
MGLLEGKNILVTGIVTRTSIAYRIAEVAQREGATLITTSLGRVMKLTDHVLRGLDPVPPLVELDVTDEDQLAGLAAEVGRHVDRLDGVVHSIAFANPARALGGAYLSTGWEDVALSLRTSAYSLVALTMACQPLFAPQASVVGLTFDARLTWPAYDWMGVAKAALESASRYVARYLGPQGVRCNLIAAGPLDTMAKKAIAGSTLLNAPWDQRAPLGWDATDATPVAKAAVALLSDWFEATTGEMIHVDGGFHSTGI